MEKLTHKEIRTVVRENYGKIAESEKAGCGCSPSSCCGPDTDQDHEATAADLSRALGYSEADVSDVPDGSNMGLGCGNPQAIASLQEGETVLDLGSGGGFDCFLAARAVGSKGHIIGVDMTPEMINKARSNADKSGFENIEFRLGEIGNLPLADGVIDVIISNCVINLSPEKERVFSESFRVLKPGGRLAISDIVATAELPEEMKQDMTLYTGCTSGAATIRELESLLHGVGFEKIKISPKDSSREFILDQALGRRIEDFVVSATIEAVKPRV